MTRRVRARAAAGIGVTRAAGTAVTRAAGTAVTWAAGIAVTRAAGIAVTRAAGTAVTWAAGIAVTWLVMAAPASAGTVGALSVVAGKVGVSGTPSPGAATDSDLGNPHAVALDGAGDLFVADTAENVVEKITPAGTLSVAAGELGSVGPPTPGPATRSTLSSPTGLAFDASGNLYIADAGNEVVEQVTPGGRLSIYAGSGSTGQPVSGPATSSPLDGPVGLAVDASGDLFIADSHNHVVEKVTPDDSLSVIAGTGTAGLPTAGAALSSALAQPEGLALDPAGNLYVADAAADVVARINPQGILSIVAGTGSPGTDAPGPATGSDLDQPTGIATDDAGNIYIADDGNADVDKVTPADTLSVIAGTGAIGPPTSGPAASSKLGAPVGVGFDNSGNLYIADSANYVIERVFGEGTDPTSTALACTPRSIPAGSAVTCSVTVTDTATGGGVTTPAGTVSFLSSPATGSFSARSCTLAAVTRGAASCHLRFTPFAAGHYTVTGSYVTSGLHTGSAGASAVTATANGHASVGRVSVSGATVRVPVTCTGHSECSVKLALSVLETVSGGKVISVAAAAAAKGKRSKRTVAVGSSTVSVAAGKRVMVKVTLNSAGKRLLKRIAKLGVRLVVTQSGKAVKTTTVTFRTRR